ncbi:hypothetical protein Pla108_33110 [Botrimarina colliarenosi]|uniref:Uncharacterized protein n=1 Tax=Botrimarina colliarenosi TaxID=2528001 RepID=A0A5C6A6N0_9BACT|nr:hypothetical protein [Botrimarina colliarenosi]TWT95169.1 hypothetical protein Pla108_33110 [Botrimarina colliarenosi]
MTTPSEPAENATPAVTDPAVIDPANSEAPAEGVRVAGGFRRLALIVLASMGLMVFVAIGVVFGLYKSATAAVPAYEAVVEVDPAVAETQRREFESQLSTLVSDTRALPEWKSRVTADQINAWLALRLERDFPGFQKAGLLAPRVMLEEGKVILAARSRMSRIEGILSVTLLPLVTESDELALEIESAKIGRLSLPLDAIMAQIRQTPLAEIGPIRLSQTGETAAVVVDLDRIKAGHDKALRLTGVDVRPGELLLRGETKAP